MNESIKAILVVVTVLVLAGCDRRKNPEVPTPSNEHGAKGSAESRPGNDKSDSRTYPLEDPTGNKTYTFKSVYKPGDKLLLTYHFKSEMPMPVMPFGTSVLKGEMILALPVAVTRDGSGTHSLVNMKVRRAQLKRDFLGSEFVDTRKPETLKRSMTPEIFHKVDNILFQAKVNAIGQIEDFKRIGEQHDPQNQGMQMIASLENGPFKLCIQEPCIYLPSKPVRIGDNWGFRRQVQHLAAIAGYAAAPMDEKSECKLLKVKNTPDGRVAVVGVQGTMTAGKKEELSAYMIVKLKKTGSVEYNIDKGTLEAHNMISKGTVTVGMSGSGSHTSKINLAVTAELKRDENNKAEKELETGVGAANIGAPAEPTKQLGSVDADALAAAARIITGKGPHATTPVPQLVLELKDPGAEVRMRAAMALGDIGLQAKEAVPALLAAADDKNGLVRALVAGALGKTGRGAKGVVPALIGMLGDEHREARRAAATGLGDIGQADKPVLKALIATLGKDPDGAVRVDAAGALGQLGPKANSAVPALLLALKDGYVQHHAAEALGKIGRSAVKPLIDLAARGDSDKARLGGIQALGKLGALAKSAVPVLLKCLRDKSADVRNASARALPKIKPVEKEVVAALASRLEDKDRHVRTAAAGALGDVGPTARSAVPSLLTALKDEDWGVIQSAAIALGEIGVSEPSVISGLSRALRIRSSLVQMAATEALGKMPKAAAPAVPNLIAVLSDERAVQVEFRGRLTQLFVLYRRSGFQPL